MTIPSPIIAAGMRNKNAATHQTENARTLMPAVQREPADRLAPLYLL